MKVKNEDLFIIEMNGKEAQQLYNFLWLNNTSVGDAPHALWKELAQYFVSTDHE